MNSFLSSLISIAPKSANLSSSIQMDQQEGAERELSFELPSLSHSASENSGENPKYKVETQILPVSVSNAQTQAQTPDKFLDFLVSVEHDMPLEAEKFAPSESTNLPRISPSAATTAEPSDRPRSITHIQQSQQGDIARNLAPERAERSQPTQTLHSAIPAKSGQIDRSFEVSSTQQMPLPVFIAPSATGSLKRHLDFKRTPIPESKSQATVIDKGDILPVRPLNISTSTQNHSPLNNIQLGSEQAWASRDAFKSDDIQTPKISQTGVSVSSATSSGYSAVIATISSVQSPVGVSNIPEQFSVKPTNETALVAERTLDIARGDLWLNDLAKDIVSARHAERELSFRMQPENLGRLDVDITNQDDGMSLFMKTSSDEATQLVANSQSKLSDELRSQGVRVIETEVQTRSDSQSQQDTRKAPASRNAAQENSSPDSFEDEKSKAETAEKQARFA